MKSKILTLAAIMLLITSCGTKKTAVATAPETIDTMPPRELSLEQAEGKKLYENNCTKCHKLYEPTKFDKEKWQPILVRMQKKAKLDDANMALITSYIHSQL
ncbi:cytochrome C [Flavobacterium defluvii]|uniref:Dihaem cytochrome c n=1 Tax=Flavobacterium defluvii TaxID=370979 RepID=A0A1M5R9R1_9FLAO|nr:cytochrome C [Flavobacterium defluvii]SHH23097.1 Dihaem cytochrome c [Flavobacterium defluvii]